MPDELERLRAEIDDIDGKLVELLRERMAVVSRIGAYKREHALPVLSAEREQAVLDKIRTEAGPELAAYTETVFRTIMACSRDAQKRRYGLIGLPLAHSFSPAIHAKLADYDYKLFELREEQLVPFLKERHFDGVNVTIPYKKAAMACCDELTEQARHVGCVNTIIRRADGTLLGHNTDYDGFRYLLGSAGVEIRGKKAIVLGTGGAAAAVQAVLYDLGAAEIVLVSRHGESNYVTLYDHSDAQLLVNATPVGMYPNTGVSPVNLARLPGLKCVLDVVYNPAKTQLLLDAEKLGLQTGNGLGMLVAQAKAAAECFIGRKIDDEVIERIRRDIERETKNVLLIGMPGCGKTTVGRALAEATGRKFTDLDELVTARAGRTIPEIFDADGEDTFRALEHEVLCDTAKRSGLVIACGGGIVTRGENLDPMRQNSTVVWLLRDIGKLPTDGRPLSQTQPLETLFRLREPLYRAAADLTADNNGSVAETVRQILEAFMKLLILNGPNLNMLGIREPDIYGNRTYRELEQFLYKSAKELGVEIEVFQSNSEGGLIDKIQEAYFQRFDGIVINPAAYTHTSIAILDALKAVALPSVEVHLSQINEREAFRHISYTAMACEKSYAGFGFEGYRMAIQYLLENHGLSQS